MNFEKLKNVIKKSFCDLGNDIVFLHFGTARTCDWEGFTQVSTGTFQYNFKIPFTYALVDDDMTKIVLIVKNVKCMVDNRNFEGEFQLHLRKEFDYRFRETLHHYYYLYSNVSVYGFGDVTKGLNDSTPEIEIKLPEELIEELYPSLTPSGSLTKRAL